MISARIETLKYALIREFTNQNFSQKLFWKKIFSELIGKRIFVMWVDPKKIQKSKVVRVVKATRHFAVCEELMWASDGEPRNSLTVTIDYAGLIGRSRHIEILDEEV